MKKITLVVIYNLLFFNVFSQIQTERAVVNLHDLQQFSFTQFAVPITKAEPFLAYALVWKGQESEPRIRFSVDGNQWSDWQIIQQDAHFEQDNNRIVSRLYITYKYNKFFQISGLSQDAELHFYSPDATPETSLQNPVQPRSEDCPCAQPGYQNRANWCPDNNCPPNASPSFTNVTHLIVHHSAGTNIANDWAAIVRAIWNLHVNVNGWADVGYNWLIDPNGVVYEGRGDDILGAHFCGTNGGTMGVCLLGDFTNIEPATAAQNSLIELLAWKSCDQSIDPLGVSLHASSGRNLRHISGHRDGCNTACPGNMFYPLLDGIILGVADYIETVCSVATGTDQVLSVEEFLLFPNPADETVQFSFKSPLNGRFQFTIQNMAGITIQIHFFDKKQEYFQENINIHELPAGIYTFTLRHEQGIISGKIVKQ